MMAQVGAFPDPKRRIIRASVNPLDRSTVVSIYPQNIDEVKHTIQPGRFKIAAGSYEKPSILIVGTSSWWREIDEDQPLLEIPVSSIQIADSIVKDYVNGLLACDMGVSMPGLFYVPGCINDKNNNPSDEATLTWIQTAHRGLLDKALAQQRDWYHKLVALADTLWARSNGNPLTIGDNMRLAAQELNLKDKEWIKDFSTIELIRCVACGSLNNSKVIVCPTCKVVVDPKRFAEMKLQFAS